MEWITVISEWFSANESVLSGVAAFIAIMGILLSPLLGNLKTAISRKPASPDNSSASGFDTKSHADSQKQGNSRQSAKPAIYIEPFTGSSDEASKFARELEEDVRRATTNFTGSILVADPELADCVARVNVLLTGSRCRTTLHLRDHHNKEDFLSDRFDSDIEDRLEAIDRLSSQISTTFRYGVSRRLLDLESDDIQVVLTRMGMAHISSDQQKMEEALTCAERLLDQEAENSMFQALYCGLLWSMQRFDYRPIPDEQLKNAELSARKAVALNPRSDFAHHTLGRHLLHVNRDYKGARRCFLRSIELTPRYHAGEAGLGEVEIFSGDVQKGIALCKQEFSSPVLGNGRYHDAVAAGEITLGNYHSAIEIAEDAIHKYGDVTQTLVALAAAAGLAESAMIAQDTVNLLKKRHPEISLDTLHRWPFKDDADWNLFVSGLKKAGLD